MEQRQIAFDILYKTIKEESYSNLLMRRELEKLPKIQRGFVTQLVNGVLRNYEYLDHQFSDQIKPKTAFRLRLILCMALYEKYYLDQPDYVIVNEYVGLGQNRHEKGFLNALLRSIGPLKDSGIPNVDSCLPEWIYKLLASQYDAKQLQCIIGHYRQIPKVYYRLNRKRASFADLEIKNISLVNDELFTSERSLFDTPEYKKGYFYVQDINSAGLYHHLNLEKGQKLLDMCSAPGSKLFNCLDVLDPEDCYANDVHETRVELIRKMAAKLGFDGIHYSCLDGRKLSEKLDLQFDRILLDAPCSGLGVIGRRPDLKFHVRPQSLDELQVLQKELLAAAKMLLKEDGIILYATCTLNKKENSRLIGRFLDENKDMELLEEDTVLDEGGDMFYYAKMRKLNHEIDI